MSLSQPEFDDALKLIDELQKALSRTDVHAQYVHKKLIQQAIDYLEKNGFNPHKFKA
jgi:hypothetical protein